MREHGAVLILFCAAIGWCADRGISFCLGLGFQRGSLVPQILIQTIQGNDDDLHLGEAILFSYLFKLIVAELCESDV